MSNPRPPTRTASIALTLVIGLLGGLLARSPSAKAQLRLPPVLLERAARGYVEAARREGECVAVVRGVVRGVAREARLRDERNLAGAESPTTLDRATRLARRAQDRALSSLFGPIGHRMGLYAGKNLARDDGSHARLAGLKLRF